MENLMKIFIVSSLILTGLILSCGNQNTNTESGNIKKTKVTDTSPGIPVEAYYVKNQTIEDKLRFTGVLEPFHSVDIVSEASGKVIKINKDLGDSVSKNEIMAIIDDIVPESNFKQAQAQVLSAENNLKIAELNLQSDKQLYENGDISKLAYDNSVLAVKTAEANHLAALANLSLMEKQFNNTRIISPINGVVSRKYIEIGTMVTLTMPVYRVVDLDYLKLKIGVPQSSIRNIKVGDEANVTISALNNKTYSGFVKYISPQADESTGAFNTEIHIKNTAEKTIIAGMTAKVELILKTEESQIIVPSYAVVTKNEKKYLYKVDNEIAKLTPILAGETIGSQVVIREGVNEGDIIVVVGMKNLGTETKVLIETLHNQN